MIKQNAIDYSIVPLSTLKRFEYTPRTSLDQKYVKHLEDSIQKEGLFNPIVGRVDHERQCVSVIDGEHRVEAHINLGLGQIPVKIINKSRDTCLFLALRLNQERGKKVTAFEEGLHIKKIIEEEGLTQGDVAKSLGKSQSWVSQRLKLVENASKATVDAIITRVINKASAREIVKLPRDTQELVIEKVTKEHLSSRETGSLVEAIEEKPESLPDIIKAPVTSLTKPHADFQDYEEKHGDKPMFERGECPSCYRNYVVNWVTHSINWEDASDE